MVFKPFKPPLMRNSVSNPIEITDEPERPAKKARIEDEDSAGVPSTNSTPLGNRKPLLQVGNREVKNTKEVSAAELHKDGTSDERYFNVLW